MYTVNERSISESGDIYNDQRDNNWKVVRYYKLIEDTEPMPRSCDKNVHLFLGQRCWSGKLALWWRFCPPVVFLWSIKPRIIDTVINYLIHDTFLKAIGHAVYSV